MEIQLMFLAAILTIALGANMSDSPAEMKKEQREKNKSTHPKIEEFNKNAHLRPTKCQVCRVFVQELQEELAKTDGKKETVWMTHRLDDDFEPEKKIDFKVSEMRLMDILENVCKGTTHYRTIAGPEFPYLKGVKSMFRSQVEQEMAKSGLRLSLDAPGDIVDDPTFEIKRMKYRCEELIENYEAEILEWYKEHRDKDPLTFLCEEQVLEGNDTDCLTATTEVPEYADAPLPSNAPSHVHTEF